MIGRTIVAYQEGDGLLIGNGPSRSDMEVSREWIRSDTAVPVHE